MNLKIIKFSVFLFLVYLLTFPARAQAVIPPDFVFNIGAQVAQFFSIVVVFSSAVFGAFFQYFRLKFAALKHKKIVLFTGLVFVLATSLILAYFYAQSKQKAEYQKWLQASKDNGRLNQSSKKEEINIDDPKLEEAVTTEPAVDENDQLTIGNEKNTNIDTSLNKFVSVIDITDDAGQFISQYYENIARGNLEQAYSMSKKSVDFSTFRNWYVKTTKITLDKLVRIDEKKSSIELTLYESQEFTRYGVLMTLTLENDLPTKVEKSEVKILAQGAIEDGTVKTNEDKVSEEYSFFDRNSSKNIMITNQEFQEAQGSGNNDFIVLDAREDIEYENGNFPDSTHIRFADLKAGRWIELPKDKFVYVICWSGIRGREVAEFLRTKKIIASYLENGANGWVDFGGQWQGSIKFNEKYTDPRYQAVFNTEEVRNKVKEGIFLIDTREPGKFKQEHIGGSLNIPIMYTPTINLEEVFGQVPEKSKVITVCDGYVNCFDAKITGVELERRGHEFLGRYNKPWEYE